MTIATLVLVRPDPDDPTRSRSHDLSLAGRHAKAPPCWVFLVGGTKGGARAREARLTEARRAVGIDGIAADGVETGTGKEVVATMLHEQSGRRGRFMAQNAAQLPHELADSLLFGHVKGAFTGADRERPGRVREARNGTFFLDEAFNLSPPVQAKLIRTLNRVEEGLLLVEPVGSTSAPEPVPARLIVSALTDPRTSAAAEGTSTMRSDLYYRVSAGIIRLPPLRQSLDDLPALCAHLRAALDTNRLPPGAKAFPLPCNLDLELKRREVATLRAALRETGKNKARAGRRVGMARKNARNFGRRLETAERQLRDLESSDAV